MQIHADLDPLFRIRTDPVELSQWIQIQAGKNRPKKEKNEKISHLKSSLEGRRLLLEPERPLHGLSKKFAALLN